MTRLNIGLLVTLLLAASMGRSHADSTFTVQRVEFADQKAVFATVESPNVVPARARIGGTVMSLAVREGDTVTQGQTVAVVGDEKLLLQIKSLDARGAGLEAQLAQAKLDVARAEILFRQGAGPRTTLEQARTAMDVASSALRAWAAERAVLTQNLNEGQVLAPVAGRVLTTPLTIGSVVLNGDTVATIGELPFMLRLRIPERHALSMKVGDPIRLDARQLGVENGAAGTIALIYPKIEEGRVVADARVSDLGQYFVGDRVRNRDLAMAADGDRHLRVPAHRPALDTEVIRGRPGRTPSPAPGPCPSPRRRTASPGDRPRRGSSGGRTSSPPQPRGRRPPPRPA